MTDLSAQCFDVAVVGAGLGGACAAISLARRGVRVALVEAGDFPRHKVCGEFLSPEIRQVFARLGLENRIEAAHPERVRTARLISKAGRADLPLPDEALALSRWSLDQILWNAAREAGSEGFAQTRVRRIEKTVAGFQLQTARGGLHARAVIAAPGRAAAWLFHQEADGRKQEAGRVDLRLPASCFLPSASRFFGLKAHFKGVQLERGVTELHAFKGGYCGLVRVEDGLTNVCLLARYDRLQKRAPQEFWADVLRQCPQLAQQMEGAIPLMAWMATGNVAFNSRRPANDGILRVGDAAGFIHPLTGDGMAMAARGGELAASCLLPVFQARPSLSVHDAVRLYEAAWQREFANRLKWAKRLQPLFLQPTLSFGGVTLVRRVPRLGRLAVRHTRG